MCSISNMEYLVWPMCFVPACLVLAQSDFSSPRRYVLNPQPLTWNEANEFCQENGGHLAKVYDISTIPDLHLPRTLTETNPLFWIGLSKGDIDGWSWVDGTTLTWENWDTTDTVIKPPAKLCVTANDTYPSSWRIEACARRLPSLCQYEGGDCSIISYVNHSIAGHNSLYLYEKTAEECKQMCLTEPTIFCVSFEHSPREGVCQFNTGNRWTHPSFFAHSDGWNYYHKTCNTGEIITSNLTVVTTTSVPLEQSTSSTYVMPCSPVFEEVNVTVTTTQYSTVYSTVTRVHMISLFVNDTIDPVEELQEIQEVLKEKKKQRTKVSYEDKRPSATYVGYVAIAFLSCVFGSIVLFDLLTVFRDVKVKKKSKLKRKYNVLDAIARRKMNSVETKDVNDIVNDIGERSSSGHRNVNNGPNETNSGQSQADQAFSIETDSISVTEMNENMNTISMQMQRRLLWKKLWPGFQKLQESQDHDSGTESDVSGVR